MHRHLVKHPDDIQPTDGFAEAQTLQGEADQSAGAVRTLSRVRRFASWMISGDRPVVCLLLLLPVIMWSPAWFGRIYANANYLAQVGTVTPGYLSGQPTIDPNIGFTSQALGHQAAAQWFSGTVPWWNPYEGVGVPLAAEMQSAAFLPLTLLLKFENGQLVFHVVLQLIAGLSTYFLLRQLRLSRFASATGAILFEFNGVFALLANAIVNPVPFLPLLLLGIERAYASARSPHQGRVYWLATGWAWIAVALALSFLAGFPEVAYINGLLAAIWVIVRFVVLGDWAARGRFAVKVGAGLIVGTMLAAPLLVAFATYLPLADTGLHATIAGTLTLPNVTLAEFFHPYLAGGILTVPEFEALLGTGGYIGLTAAFLALLGAWGRRERVLRIALLCWIIIALGKTFGIAPFMALINRLPYANLVVFFRYANASWIMAATILVAFALNEWRGTLVDRAKVVACAAVCLVGLSLGSLWLAAPLFHQLRFDPHYSMRYFVLSIGAEWLSVLILVAAFLAGRSTPRVAPTRPVSQSDEPSPTKREVHHRVAPILAGAIVSALALVYFVVPILSYPRSATIDYPAIRFLQDHIGFNRFFSIGPFAANYGSYYDVANVNDNDLPVPLAWETYIHQHLDPYARDLLFFNTPRLDPSMPDLPTVMSQRLDEYEQVGVKFIVVSPGQQPFARVPSQSRPKLVYHDQVMDIYELPHPAPFFGMQRGGCDVQARSWNAADVHCAAPGTLIRRSLTFPGWHAEINGREVPIGTHNSIFEEVAVPAGASHVVFWYLPPHERLAIAVCILALMLLATAIGVPVFAGSASRMQRHQQHPDTPESDGEGKRVWLRDVLMTVIVRLRARVSE